MTNGQRHCAAASIPARLATLAAAAAAVLGAAGCGVGAGSPPTGVTLTVTQDHGQRVLLDRPKPRLAGEATVLRLLGRNATVTTRYGGAFVDSIDGVRGDGDRGWFYWVNGLAADRGAADWTLSDGDRVWWDRGASAASPGETPAVVGSFPAPLAGGYDGGEGTVVVVCPDPALAACRVVTSRLAAIGARAAKGRDVLLAPTDRRAPIRVLVSRADDLPELGDEARALLRGPSRSGVAIRRRGGHLETLDDDGRTVRRLGPGTGVVAAMRRGRGAPVWVVTGTDDRGVRRAAAALDEATLRHKLAAVIDADGARGLPEGGA